MKILFLRILKNIVKQWNKVLLRFLAEALVASGLNVKVYVDDALTILLVTAKIHEAPIINLYLKS